ncbi:MAG: response regulator [Deltaproteobacteria bacterium]|nr:response regulator [Deltaproteobacteria bacterium]MBW2017308.1 response regulator [Deltaproteobacteria bacterium]MBW2129409.1 response regulator [Deltaproteobacteria bacterium]MBW2303581.1 response regulator [Deltaproteobacteria bacterium]
MKVLVVDGDTAVRSSTVELIRGWGHDADSSATGRETLEKVQHDVFDLALLDIDLQDISAKELIGKLKDLSPKIGIVTMTEQSADELEKQIRTLGIIYYMCKPINEKALKEIIDHMSKKRTFEGVGKSLIG